MTSGTTNVSSCSQHKVLSRPRSQLHTTCQRRSQRPHQPLPRTPHLLFPGRSPCPTVGNTTRSSRAVPGEWLIEFAVEVEEMGLGSQHSRLAQGFWHWRGWAGETALCLRWRHDYCKRKHPKTDKQSHLGMTSEPGLRHACPVEFCCSNKKLLQPPHSVVPTCTRPP